MTKHTDYTAPASSSSAEPHLHYRRPGLLARLRAAWMADFDAGYAAGYRTGYLHGCDHPDLEDY